MLESLWARFVALTCPGRYYHIYCSPYEFVLNIVVRRNYPWCGLLLANVGDGRASQRDVASSST